MAVPQAVQNRMQREADALRASGIDPNGPPPGAPVAASSPSTPVASPAPAPAPSAAPTTDEVAALRARNAELEAELRTQGGRVSATASELADLKNRLEMIGGNRQFLETSVSELNERNAALEAELAELRAKGTASQLHSAVSTLDEAGPTPEQVKEYGQDGIEFVQRVVKQQLAAIVKPLLADITEIKKQLIHVKDVHAKLPKIEETVKVADANNARAMEERFLAAEVLPYYPDFPTVRTTQEWRDYLARDTGRGYPIGVLLKTYRQQNDATNIRAVIGAFYEQRKKPSLESLAVPGKTTADAPEAPAPVKLKSSEYQRNLRMFTAKRMPKADWDAYRARWDQALQAGNVEMDVELR